MACTIEAILGAVYLDGGNDGLQEVLTTLGFTHEFLDLVTVNLLPLPFNERDTSKMLLITEYTV